MKQPLRLILEQITLVELSQLGTKISMTKLYRVTPKNTKWIVQKIEDRSTVSPLFKKYKSFFRGN